MTGDSSDKKHSSVMVELISAANPEVFYIINIVIISNDHCLLSRADDVAYRCLVADNQSASLVDRVNDCILIPGQQCA